MEYGWIAVAISVIALLYATILGFIFTRALYRSLVNKKAPPIHLQVTMEGTPQTVDKKDN